MSKICFFLFSFLLAHAALATHYPDQQKQSPIERLRECSTRCQGEERLESCQKRCQDEYQREKEAYGDERIMSKESESKREQRQNPYVFEDRHFITGMQTQHGRLRILQKFNEESNLLKGIQNYRVAVLEVDPQAFVVPQHWDADSVVFVSNGKGTVSFVRQDRRESFNVKQGDLLRIRAGTTTYLINRDNNNNERLVLVQLVQPVNTPGRFEAFNPESFLSSFSDDILEAAFNVKRDKLQRVFGRQKQGEIVKASQEQIRAMTQQEEGGIWPFGGESKGTVNLYQQRPTHSNQYGQLYEVDSRQYRQLQDLDIAISLANFTQGAMGAPYYNSKATKIAVVVEGEGYLEMACPHLSQSQGRSQQGGSGQQAQRESVAGPTYQKISTRLKRGTVVVVPAGHPSVAVASENQGLQLLCFEVNYRDNEKFPLAGKRNVMRQLEREAKELAFGVSAREVDEVFNSQQDEFFLKGPRQQQRGRAEA